MTHCVRQWVKSGCGPGGTPVAPGGDIWLLLHGISGRNRRRMAQYRSSLHRLLLVTGVLTLLAAVGLLLTNYRPATALTYWSIMFPAFGVVALWQLFIDRTQTENLPLAALQIAAHWLGPLIALRLLFLQLHRGQMDADAVGATTLLLLGVTSFLAGIYQDRIFFFAALILALGTVVATEIEAYIWLIVVVGLVAVAAIVGGAALWRRANQAFSADAASRS
jgi:hypothetical protein